MLAAFRGIKICYLLTDLSTQCHIKGAVGWRQNKIQAFWGQIPMQSRWFPAFLFILGTVAYISSSKLTPNVIFFRLWFAFSFCGGRCTPDQSQSEASRSSRTHRHRSSSRAYCQESKTCHQLRVCFVHSGGRSYITAVDTQEPDPVISWIGAYITDSRCSWDAVPLFPHYASIEPLLEFTFSPPATSAPVERIFSQGGLFVRPHRARISDKLLCQLMLAKCNRDVCQYRKLNLLNNWCLTRYILSFFYF